MRAFWVLLAFSSLGLTQPYVNYRGIVNVASYMAPGLPAGSLPRGGMVAIFGRNLGPTAGVQVSVFPLGATLSGVSIAVTQKSTTVSALPVYVSAGQVNAIIPSNAPLGRVSIVVTVNTVASNPSPANVVSSSFGSFSVNSAGFGPGIIQNYSAAGVAINSPQATAQPNEVEVLWGTGLGPVAQDNVAPTPVTLPVQVEVFVGGESAGILYAGRTGCCSGIDQINFTVPAGAPAGCYVPVVVRVGGTVVSNTVTMAINPNGAPCTDPANSLAAALRTGGRFGAALLTYQDIRIDAFGAVESYSGDEAAVSLRQEAGGVWAFNPYVSLPPLGTCTAYGIAGDYPALNGLPGITPSVQDLNGGATLSLTGPSTVSLGPTMTSPAFYSALLAVSLTVPGVLSSFFTSGTASTLAGAGGADVGAFQTSVTSGPDFDWTNQAAVTTVTRTAGFTVTWSNPPPGATAVSIIGYNVDPANNASGGFQCLAVPSAGTFTVPAVALGNVPATPSGASLVKGWISVGAALLGSGASFSANGLDRGIAVFASSSQQSAVYQ